MMVLAKKGETMLSNRWEREKKRIRIETAIEVLAMELTQAQMGVEIDEDWLGRELREARKELVKLND